MQIHKINFKKILYYVFLVVATCICLGIFFYLFGGPDDVEAMSSNLDGKHYHVRNKGPVEVKQKAVDHLAELSAKVDILVTYMKQHQLPDRETADRLYNRWRKCKLRETSSSEKSAAYTVNKGEEMRICIRKNGRMEDPNTSMFVILHELGHVASITFGHDSSFRENFSYLTHLAAKLGLYEPEDFVNNSKIYCGTEINTSPCSQGTCTYNPTPEPVEAFGNVVFNNPIPEPVISKNLYPLII
jgi:hypothetical protein